MNLNRNLEKINLLVFLLWSDKINLMEGLATRKTFLEGLKHFDWVLFLSALLLVSLGLIMIYSASLKGEIQNFEKIKIQIFACFLGLFFLFFLAFLDYRVLRDYSLFLYFLLILLLMGVLFFGQEIRGTRGWFLVGPFQFQPSEIARIILIIFFAKYLALQERINFKNILQSGLIFLLPVFLIILERDLGNSFVLIGIWFLGILLSKKRIRHILFPILLLLIFFFLGWFFFLEDFQKERILVFLGQSKDPKGVGYQINQAIIAIGSGGIFGKGLGFGSQSQLYFLPERHTDFIFASALEELGFFAGVLILGLFFVFFWRIIRALKFSPDLFSFFLISFIFFSFLFQFFINLGMNLGLCPIIGLPLPLISYGGSNLFVNMILLGILESIILRSKRVKF